MIDFEKFIKQCDEICEINTKYIEEFVDELSKKGFVEKTIKNHYFNVDFYLNDFLLREEALTMENGCKVEYLSDFFGYFFMEKKRRERGNREKKERKSKKNGII